LFWGGGGERGGGGGGGGGGGEWGGGGVGGGWGWGGGWFCRVGPRPPSRPKEKSDPPVASLPPPAATPPVLKKIFLGSKKRRKPINQKPMWGQGQGCPETVPPGAFIPSPNRPPFFAPRCFFFVFFFRMPGCPPPPYYKQKPHYFLFNAKTLGRRAPHRPPPANPRVPELNPGKPCFPQIFMKTTLGRRKKTPHPLPT